MASSTESESDTETVDLSLPDADLWAQLPRRFRTAYGAAGGHLPDDAFLAYMFEDASELAAEMSSFVPQHDRRRAIQIFSTLQARALPQKVSLAKKLASSNSSEAAGLQDTLSWLVKHSGARRERNAWPTRAARKLADSKLGLSRAAVEKAELQRWRAHLVELFVEANTPLVRQAQLASNPESAIAASLGSMRASTIRKRVREWRRLRVFTLGLSACPRPKHVGVVLD